jgi:hypothetical protein
MNTQAFARAQYEYDNAQEDYENEAFELAVEARADEVWKSPEDVQGCIDYYGVNTLPLSTCQEMVKAASDPTAPRWLVELVTYIDDNCVRKWAETLVREGE